MTILFFIAFTAAGAFLYRLRGAEWLPFLHRPIKQTLYCLGPTIATFLILNPGAEWSDITLGDWLPAAIAGVLSVAAVCSGHGAFFDLGHTKNPEHVDERPVSWILRPLAKLIGIKPTTFAYDAIGLTLNGLLMTLPFALLFGYHGEWLACLLALLAGASKTLAYLIGRQKPEWGPTEVGEWLTGAFQWGLFAAAYLIAGGAS